MLYSFHARINRKYLSSEVAILYDNTYVASSSYTHNKGAKIYFSQRTKKVSPTNSVPKVLLMSYFSTLYFAGGINVAITCTALATSLILEFLAGEQLTLSCLYWLLLLPVYLCHELHAIFIKSQEYTRKYITDCKRSNIDTVCTCKMGMFGRALFYRGAYFI